MVQQQTPCTARHTYGRRYNAASSSESYAQYNQSTDQMWDFYIALYDFIHRFAESTGQKPSNPKELKQFVDSLFAYFSQRYTQQEPPPQKRLPSDFWSSQDSDDEDEGALQRISGMLTGKPDVSISASALTSRQPGDSLVNMPRSSPPWIAPQMPKENRSRSQTEDSRHPRQNNSLEEMYRIHTQAPGFKAGQFYASTEITSDSTVLQGNSRVDDGSSNFYGPTRVTGGGCLIQGNVPPSVAANIAAQQQPLQGTKQSGCRLGSSQDVVGRPSSHPSRTHTSAAEAARLRWVAH